ncbi:MAG TPA: hypothetical protein VE978_22245 [Chitinophagales bacterium]|nr:hypothetical protein [Chitinophagales bacterium]
MKKRVVSKKSKKAGKKKSVVDSLVGIIKGVPEDIDYKELIWQAIKAKHGI